MTNETGCDRLDRRRQAIIKAGRTLFLEKGYEGTTLQDVVKVSGGSLATVYKLFGSKEGLLDAVVFEKVFTAAEVIRDIVNSRNDPATAIREIGAFFRDRWLEENDVALTRIVMARSVSDSEFARRFFERTALHTREVLKGAFEKWQAEGHALTASPALLAQILWAMTVSDMHAEAMSHGALESLTQDVLEERTSFFLRGAGLSPTI